MKKQLQQKTPKKESEVTLKDLFNLVDAVAKKASNDKHSKKIIDSAAQRWENDSRYAF